MAHPPVAVAAIMMIPASNATMMAHLPARVNPTAAAVALLPHQVPRIPVVVDMVPDMMGDVPTALIITGAALHHQEAMIATEVLLEAVVALLPHPLVETVMDHRHTVEAVAPLLTTATAVVVDMVQIPAAHTVELLILTVAMVDHLPSRRAQAVVTLQDLLAVEMTLVDSHLILLR